MSFYLSFKERQKTLFILACLLLCTLLLTVACGPQSGAEPEEEAAVATEAPTEAAAEPTEEPAEEQATEPAAEESSAADVEADAEENVESAATTEVAQEVTEETEPDPVVEDQEAPVVELPAADAQQPTGRVIAEAGVNIRIGPGTAYDLVGIAPQGTEGEIIGVSEDGQWWVARVPTAPDEQGWVAAVYVEATDAADVPIIPAPPLPEATTEAGTEIGTETGTVTDTQSVTETGTVTDTVSEAGTVSESAIVATPVPVPDELPAESVILFSASRVLLEGNRAYDLEDIYMVSPQAGATAELIIENAMQPAALPDGGMLAFRSTQPDGLGLSAFDFGADERVRYSSHLEDSTPRWSPSGDRLVFSSNRTGDRLWRIYITEPIPGDDTVGFTDAVDLGFGKDADWHPSEDLLVFKGCDDSGNSCGLWTINVDGSERNPLTDGFNDSLPRWSPDGAAMVFMSDSRDGNWELYTLSVADGTVTRLTEDPASDGLPAWSPDGSQIAFMSNRGDAWGIWVIPASGGEAQRITQLEEQLPDWLLQGLDWPR